MEPLIIGAGSEQAEVFYLFGVLFIMLAGLVMIIRAKGVLVLLLLGVLAIALSSFSSGERSDREPIPISPLQQPQLRLPVPSPYRRCFPFLLLGNARSTVVMTSGGSALRARTRDMNSTTSSRRSPRSIFETTDWVIPRRRASSTWVTSAFFRSALKTPRNAAYS